MIQPSLLSRFGSKVLGLINDRCWGVFFCVALLFGANAASAEASQAQTSISSAVMESSYVGTLEVYSHARTGNKLDGSYKIIDGGGSYTVATFRDGVLEGLWQRYNSQRTLLEQGSYMAGRANGEFKRYTSSGALKSVQIFERGVAHGIWKTYSWQGNVIEAATYKDGAKVLVETFYNNGNPRNTEHYVDNLKSGVWQSYFPDGTLETEQTYQDDVLTGPFVEYFRSGNKKLAGEIASSGYRHGKWLRFYESGQLRNETFYDNGRVLGPDISFFENGDKQQSCRLNPERSDGRCELYDETGRLLQEWSIKDFQRHGDYTEYFQSGGKKHDYHYVGGKQSGVQETYSEDGVLLLLETFGKEANEYGEFRLNGPYETYYSNGDPQTQGAYVDGKKEGVWKEFTGGRLSQESTYKAHILNGRYAEYFEGRRRVVGSYANDEKDGEWVLYFYEPNSPAYGFIEEGTVRRREQWANGKKNGVWEYFTVKNALHKKEHYADDELHGAYEEFDVNSNSVVVSGAYEQGRPHGAWKYFFADGLAKERANFERGLREGPYESFHENGQLKLKGSYQSDRKEGRWEAFHQNGKPKSVESFVSNRLEGRAEYFHANGKVASEGPYVRQRKEGLWKDYWPNGQLRSEGHFLRGNQTGAWSEYDQFGKLITTRHY